MANILSIEERGERDEEFVCGTTSATVEIVLRPQEALALANHLLVPPGIG